MKEKKIKVIAIVLCLFEIYLFSFFFVFHRLNVVTGFVTHGDIERTGPKGISIVVPIGNSHVKKGLYYIYYPIHALLRAKGWVYPMYDYGDFSDMELTYAQENK